MFMRKPQHKTFDLGLEFIRTNHEEDNWFLQIETFDPHEPFFTQQHYKDRVLLYDALQEILFLIQCFGHDS